ncbi:recombinase family protein [Rathayibacter sp. AY1E5]|uniref:recombinase family protein n=1 Tax=Rathayibacter sp. AY1E5 TaxID=2080553 RepID=UPI0021575071|nr:recombinase family protein [Rathayibacter sp. AY1E5]
MPLLTHRTPAPLPLPLPLPLPSSRWSERGQPRNSQRRRRSPIASQRKGFCYEHVEAQRWSIAVLDFDLDTSTATGRLIAGMVVQIGQWEREMIGERTKAALAVKRADGIQLGKPSTIPAEVQALILQRKAAGASLSAIARSLNADVVPTPSGAGRWTHSVIGGVVRRWTSKEVSA